MSVKSLDEGTWAGAEMSTSVGGADIRLDANLINDLGSAGVPAKGEQTNLYVLPAVHDSAVHNSKHFDNILGGLNL